MKKITYLKLLTIFLLSPSLCSADMVVPLAFIGEGIFYAIFTGCIFVLIVWGAEAYAIKTKLKDNTKKPLKVSFIANAITSLMGVVYFVLLGYFVIPLLGVFLDELYAIISFFFFVLIAPFYITFYTEACVLKKYYKTYPYKQLKNVSLQMNIITYSLFFLFAIAAVGGIGILMIITPILAYYLVRLFQMYTFEMNIKKYKRYIYSTLIIIITFVVAATVTIGPLAPPERYSGARRKGLNASIKANLKTTQVQAELFYDNDQRYDATDSFTTGGVTATNACNLADSMFAETAIANAIAKATDAGSESTTRRCSIASDGQTWAISIQYKDMTGSWCVDSTGYTGDDAGKNTATGGNNSGTSVPAVCGAG